MIRIVLKLLIFSSFCINCSAQKIQKEDFFFVDKLVQDAGMMDGASLQYIVDSITKECKTELQTTRAFYRWQALFIEFDIKRMRHPERFADNASTALMERKAGSEGFAQMFKAMCDLKKIECTVVKGVLRSSLKDIGRFNANAIHYWNVITIDHSKYLVDACLSGGYFDQNKKNYTKEYTDAWWLCNRKLFACSHLPKDKTMQLLESPITKTEFAQAPLVFVGAIVAGIVPTKTVKGILRGVADSSTLLKFNTAGQLNVSIVEASFDEQSKIDIPFNLDAYGFYITMPNGPAKKHVASIFIKNKLAFVFKTEMRKAAVKRK